MAKNKLEHLNDHLFAQLERLGDEDLTAENLEKEVVRGTAIIRVSRGILETGKLMLEAQTAYDEAKIIGKPDMLGITENQQEK